MKSAVNRILIVLALLGTTLLPLSSAHAAWLQYQSSPSDTYNRADLPPEYDIINLNFAVNDTYPDEYWFFIQFAKPITSNLFATGLNSWAGVFLDTNNDGKEDYSLETNDQPYSGNYEKDAKFFDRTSGEPKSSTRCSAKTWTNLETSANWIGFSIKKGCLSFDSTVGLRAYADHIGNNDTQFDFAPETFWDVNVNGGAVAGSGTSSSTVTSGQLPTMNSKGANSINTPSTPPEDLVQLAAEVTKSVVTVKCGKGVGSGWAIQANLSSSNIADGFNSYVITNHHVIEDCLVNRNITLLLSDQREVSAYVYSWDSENDVAGILTSTSIPSLNWRGLTPQQGWWVAAIGSPLGFPGILTTGIVSSVNTQTTRGTTNAAINPGNSGGPVFDRTGRVIGLATAKYVNSEGFGIFHGTPLLCRKILTCTGTNQVWSGRIAPSNNSAPEPTAAPTPSPSGNPNGNKKTQYINLSRQVTDTSVSAKYITLSAKADSGLKVTTLSLDLSVCSYENNRIVLYSLGYCEIHFEQEGNEIWNPASSTVVGFEVLAKTASNGITPKITETSHSSAGHITSYEWISGSNPLKSNKLTTLWVSGVCTKNGKSIQGWKNTDAKGKKYPNGSRQIGTSWKCVNGAFEGKAQVSGGTKFYIVELPKSFVGTTIEFRVNQEIDVIEYISDFISVKPSPSPSPSSDEISSPISITDLKVKSSATVHTFTFSFPSKNRPITTYELGYSILKREGLDPSFDLDYPTFTKYKTLTTDSITLSNAEIQEIYRKIGADASKRSIMFKARSDWTGFYSAWGNGVYLLPNQISAS